MSKYAIVLAGGIGAKFWPISTEKNPKQFVHLIGDGTCVQNTYKRLLRYFNNDEIFVVTSSNYDEITSSQLSEIEPKNIVLEPFGRHTAPATAIGINHLLNNGADEDSVVAIFPSDHYIRNRGEFHNSLDVAFEVAKATDNIVTIGLKPTKPETQYGYIQINIDNPIKDFSSQNVFKCLTFAEKPDIGTAERFLESGDFLWNSGIFILKISTFLKALIDYLPEYHEIFAQLKNQFGTPNFQKELKNQYKKINSISFDYGILEKAKNVICIKSSFKWSDIGSWDELHQLQLKDANNNVITGDVVSIDSRNCLINSSGKLIATVGIDDLIIVDTDEATLICKKSESDRVQEIVDFLRRNHINKFL